MIARLHLYIRGMPVGSMGIDQVFAYNLRYQVIVDTEEEHDYLFACQLLYGREIQIDTWDGWQQKRRLRNLAAHYDNSKMPLRLLPTVFTTSERILRGL